MVRPTRVHFRGRYAHQTSNAKMGTVTRNPTTPVHCFSSGGRIMVAIAVLLNATLATHPTKILKRILMQVWPNDPSSATRRTGRNDCNRDAHAGFAAAHVRRH